MGKNLIGKGVEAAKGAVSAGTSIAGSVTSAAKARLHGRSEESSASSGSDAAGSQAGRAGGGTGGAGVDSSSSPGPEGTGPSAVATGEGDDERNTVAETLRAERSPDPTGEPVLAPATPPEAAQPENLETYPSPAMRRGSGDIDPDLREGDDWDVEEVGPGGDVDVETPVGTTGADVGHNPDTAEADLQQPATPPLLDPSLTKEVKSETDTLGKAADPHKE